MKTTKEIQMPEGWGDITLKQYLQLQYDLEAYKGDDEATMNLMMIHLCGLSVDEIAGLSKTSYTKLKESISSFVEKTEHPLSRFIQIGGVEYGFEPNLSNMSYGAYCDMTRYDSIGIDTNWAKIMNILYRPVDKKGVGETYSIEGYITNGNADKWLGVTMDKHFGGFFFCANISMDLLNATLNSSMGKVGVPHNFKQTLERGGKTILQSLNSQVVTFNKSKK
jgi:hypothetical protein